MRHGYLFALALLLVLALAAPANAQTANAQKRKLCDAELDKITAGEGSSTQLVNNVLSFQFQMPAGSRQTVDGKGTVAVQVAEEAPGTTGILVIRDSAQQNLQSFINIAAVNSKVQVLVNLNININSTVGTLRQINLSGPLPKP